MNPKTILFKTTSIVILLALALGILGGLPARAAQAGPEAAPPAGLNSDDWRQIQDLLRGVLPAQQAYLKASNTEKYDSFGTIVAISGDTVVVGAPDESSNATGVNGNQNNNLAVNSGAAYVFIRSGTTWSQQAYLKASNTEAGDGFGYSVAIDGDTLVVGAIYEDSNATGVNGNQDDNSMDMSGAAYVFTRSGTTWSQEAYLKASNTEAYDRFGTSVAISGDMAVVGAYGEDSSATGVNGNQTDNSAVDSGAVYVFTLSGTTWSQQAYVKASNTGAADNFGSSVSVSGDTVVVGAPQESSNATGVNGDQNNNLADSSGAAYVFVRSSGIWSQQVYLKASNTEARDYFGFPVSVSGYTVAVAATDEDSNATGVNGNQGDNSLHGSGAIYVFTRISRTNWGQQAYLKASNPDIGDLIGSSLAISGDTIVAGTYSEDSNATGVNGNQNDNSMDMSGAAYVFTRSGTTWSQQAYVKASNTEAYDFFGWSVAVSGNTVVVGAPTEDSAATGVNGNQTDNSAVESGAVYVFSPANSAPTDITLSKSSVVENYPPGTVVGTLTAVDPDPSDTHAYYLACSVPGADDASFQINGNSLQTSVVFDYETKNTYAICIHVLDNQGGVLDKNFTISVTRYIHSSAFRSQGIKDGWVLESGENTNAGGSMNSVATTLRLGDDGFRKQYRSILSFVTSSLPDNAVITNITLYVRRQGVVGGGNPVSIFQGFMLDLRKGMFGTIVLQLTDWQAAGNKTLGPFNVPIALGWYGLDLTAGKAWINKLATGGGMTQIRLRFKVDDNNNNTANYLSLFSGNYGTIAYRPTLVVKYYLP